MVYTNRGDNTNLLSTLFSLISHTFQRFFINAYTDGTVIRSSSL